jgi:hypothetical protein
MPKLCHCRRPIKGGRIFVIKEGEKPEPQLLCKIHRKALLNAKTNTTLNDTDSNHRSIKNGS